VETFVGKDEAGQTAEPATAAPEVVEREDVYSSEDGALNVRLAVVALDPRERSAQPERSHRHASACEDERLEAKAGRLTSALHKPRKTGRCARE
jgi:hypothetical protein